jgi:hypothetical protein
MEIQPHPPEIADEERRRKNAIWTIFACNYIVNIY